MKYLTYLFQLFVIVGIGYIGYSIIFPIKPVYPTRQPFRVLTPTVSPGGTFKYEAAVCKKVEVNGTITRQILGTESKFVNTEPSNLPKGCGTSVRSVVLPLDTAPGTYRMIITAEYHINPLHNYLIRYQTEQFEVIH